MHFSEIRYKSSVFSRTLRTLYVYATACRYVVVITGNWMYVADGVAVVQAANGNLLLTSNCSYECAQPLSSHVISPWNYNIF